MEFQQLLEYCVFIEELISEPLDSMQVAEAIESIKDALELAEDDTYIGRILAESYTATSVLPTATDQVATATDQVATATDQVAKAQALLAGHHVEQRSEAWYRETMNLLTASELGTIFKSPRVRGQLVLAKTVIHEYRASGPVHSSFMTPFDWGIRFENVVKQLYEARYGVVVADVGRLRHPTLPQCAASPDGIVMSGSRAGRLIEIKCPVSRVPDNRVPVDYYAQIQQQLEVCDLEICDYVEAKFRAPYSSDVAASIGPAKHFGIVWLVQKEVNGRPEGRYIYGPIDVDMDAPISLDLGEVVMERVVWELMTWNEIVVARNRDWWNATLPRIDAFWVDVEAARRGEFQLPETSRKRVRPTTEPAEECLIVLPQARSRL